MSARGSAPGRSHVHTGRRSAPDAWEEEPTTHIPSTTPLVEHLGLTEPELARFPRHYLEAKLLAIGLPPDVEARALLDITSPPPTALTRRPTGDEDGALARHFREQAEAKIWPWRAEQKRASIILEGFTASFNQEGVERLRETFIDREVITGQYCLQTTFDPPPAPRVLSWVCRAAEFGVP
jgi:hypothetical protein